MNGQLVQAAGGVVVDSAGRMLLVHRPRYDDWSFPKGKQDPGETVEDCALREVHEETGYSCELLDLVATVRYVDHRGRDKEVRYWRMAPLSGGFEPNDEVDEIRWLPPGEAAQLLTYPRDRDVLGQAQSSQDDTSQTPPNQE